MSRVRTTQEAEAQIRDADAWWRANRAAVGYSSPATHPVRVSRYQAYYVYDERGDEVSVIAVWSAVRGRGPRLRKA